MARTSDKAAYWAGIIRRYRESGLTQPQFCRANDISLNSLRWWLHQPRAKRAMEALRDANGPRRPAPNRDRPPSVRPLASCPFDGRRSPTSSGQPDPSPRGVAAPIQVLLGGGRSVAVGPGFDADVLRRVVVALELPGC